MSIKRCLAFFLFFLDSELFAKIKKTWFIHTCFSHFINNSRSNQKFRTRFCRHYSVGNVCKISTKNIKICGACLSFHFFRQLPDFPEIIKLCLNLGIGF